MNIPKEATITDIANTLGISYSTVSRALANHPRISPGTKKKVNDLAGSLGYRPNNHARNLRNKTTHTIGVIVPKLNSLFMSSVIAGMEQVAQEHGYSLLISQSSEKFDLEEQSVKTMYNSRVDGLLVSVSYQTTDLKHFDLLFKKNIPVIFFDRCVANDDNFRIVIDNKKAGYDATTHLIKQGCKRIVHVTANSKLNVYNDRMAGFKAALQEHGLSLPDEQVIFTDLSFESAGKIAQQILTMNPRPDGVFVANDNCAAGCMVALQEAGIMIPDDISFIGFNNDLVSKVVSPKLSTVNYPGYEMGIITAKNLINQLKGTEMLKIANSIIIRSDLVLRESSKKIIFL